VFKKSDSGGGTTEKKLVITYDGVEIDPELQDDDDVHDPMKLLYIFSRSKEVSLASGEQNVELAPVAWHDLSYSNATKSYPRRYNCKQNTPALLRFADASGLATTQVSLAASGNASDLKYVTLRNEGGVIASDIAIAVTGQGIANIPSKSDYKQLLTNYPNLKLCQIYDDSLSTQKVSFSLGAKDSCKIPMHFYAQNASLGNSSNVLKADYLDGMGSSQLVVNVQSTKALAIAVDKTSLQAKNSNYDEASVILTASSLGSVPNVLAWLESGDNSIAIVDPQSCLNKALSASASCTFKVKFSPISRTAGNVFNRRLNIGHDGTTSSLDFSATVLSP
jgi:hypothetical protein